VTGVRDRAGFGTCSLTLTLTLMLKLTLTLSLVLRNARGGVGRR
jgi:hypothetical protein